MLNFLRMILFLLLPGFLDASFLSGHHGAAEVDSFLTTSLRHADRGLTRSRNHQRGISGELSPVPMEFNMEESDELLDSLQQDDAFFRSSMGNTLTKDADQHMMSSLHIGDEFDNREIVGKSRTGSDSTATGTSAGERMPSPATAASGISQNSNMLMVNAISPMVTALDSTHNLETSNTLNDMSGTGISLPIDIKTAPVSDKKPNYYKLFEASETEQIIGDLTPVHATTFARIAYEISELFINESWRQRAENVRACMREGIFVKIHSHYVFKKILGYNPHST